MSEHMRDTIGGLNCFKCGRKWPCDLDEADERADRLEASEHEVTPLTVWLEQSIALGNYVRPQDVFEHLAAHDALVRRRAVEKASDALLFMWADDGGGSNVRRFTRWLREYAAMVGVVR